MVTESLELPPGALESAAAASDQYEIPTDECCFTGCCERGKAIQLEQLDEAEAEQEAEQKNE